ncbi:unnamed protein product [Closterium sp. NIES-54]
MSRLIPLFLEGSMWRSVRWLRQVRCLRLVSLQLLARVEYSPTRLSSGTAASVTPPYRVSKVGTPISLSLAFPGPCPPSRARLPRRAFPASRGGSAPLLTPPSFLRPLLLCRLSTWTSAEFSSDLLAEFCQDEGIVQSFTLPVSPQQNGIAERRIGLIMEAARTCMIHAAAPHFLWPFAVRYATHQLNLWPRVSEPETSPTLWWTRKVGDASVFRVWGALSLVRNAKASKLSSRNLCCVFLGYPTDAPPWQFYHPCECRVFSSQDVTFDESVCFYRLHPHASHPGPAPSGVSQVDPPPLVEPLEIFYDSSSPAEGGDPAADNTAATRRSPRLETPPGFPPRPSSPPLQPATVDSGAETAGVESGGAETEGEGFGGAATGGAATRGAGFGGAGSGGPASPSGGGVVGDLAGGPGAGQPPQPNLLETLLPAGGTGGTAGGAGGVVGAGGTRGAAGAGGARATSPRGATITGGAGPTSPGGIGGAGGAGGAASAGGAGAGGTGGAGADGPGGAGTGGVGGAVGAAGAGGARAVGAGGAGAAGTALRIPFFYPQPQPSLSPPDSVLRQVLSLPSSTSLPLPLLYPLTDQSQPQLLPGSPLPAPAPHTEVTESLTERHEPETCASTPVCACRVARPRPPAVPGTAGMALRPSSVPHHLVLPEPPASSLPRVPDLESNLARVASPTVIRDLATVVTDPDLESTATFSLVTELVDFAARSHLSLSVLSMSLIMSVLHPSGVSLPLATAMDAEMASWKSTGTYINKVPPLGANIVDGMWIFRVKRPPGSSPAFKARYVARGFSHLHEEIWLHRPPDFNGSFPAGTQWSLRRPVYGLRQAPREWHDTLRTTLAALGFAPSSADPSLFLRTDTTLPPFYVLVYIDDLVFATVDTEALALVKAELQERHTCTDVGELRSYLGLQVTRDRARRTITPTQSHMVHQFLQRFGFEFSSPQPTPLSTGHSLSAPPSDESVEPSGQGSVVITGHSNASWADDQATHHSSQGYIFSLGYGSVSWRSTRSSSVLSSSCEAEIYAGAMAA